MLKLISEFNIINYGKNLTHNKIFRNLTTVKCIDYLNDKVSAEKM